jgi:hypothetical protein
MIFEILLAIFTAVLIDQLKQFIRENTRVSNYLVQSQEALLRSSLLENTIIRRNLVSNTETATHLLEAQKSTRTSYQTELNTLRELLETQNDQLRVYRTQLNGLEYDLLVLRRQLTRIRRRTTRRDREE